MGDATWTGLGRMWALVSERYREGTLSLDDAASMRTTNLHVCLTC